MEGNHFLNKKTGNSSIENKSGLSKIIKEFKLIKDNLLFLFKINYYQKESSNIIKI